MGKPNNGWIDPSQKLPATGQFVRVQIRERVGHHWVEDEGQARFDSQYGWLRADGRPLLSDDQEIVRWRPLLDSGFPDNLKDLLARPTTD